MKELLNFSTQVFDNKLSYEELFPHQSMRNVCPHRRWITKFDPDRPAIQTLSEFKVHVFKGRSYIVLGMSRNGKGSSGRVFEFVREQNDEYPHARRARMLDPVWMDEGLILNWKNLCDKQTSWNCM